MTVPKRFGVLRFFGTLLKVLAWIILVIAVLAAILAVVFGSMAGGGQVASPVPGMDLSVLGPAGGVVGGIFILLGGLLYFLILYVSGESIHLQIAVEENTRLTAALLLRMHQDGQGDTAGYGTGGFATDPYEN